MNEALLTGLLLRTSLGGRKRMIYGTTVQANKTIGCRFNNTYTYDTNEGKWNYSGGTHIQATSDSEKYFEIEIPDNLVITNFTFDSTYGAHQDNVDQIKEINLSNIGNVDSVTMLLFAFSNLKQVTSIAGFSKFKRSPLLTMEGCFRACEKLVSLDFTGLNTDDMIAGSSGGSARYGFPNCFYDCVSLQHLVLPKIPASCYMGGGTFYGCDSLTDVSCSETISNDLPIVTQHKSSNVWVIERGSPLSLASMRYILSHLSTTSPHECKFGDISWYIASNDQQCTSAITTAEGNGWTFVPNYPIYYVDDCKDISKFNTASDGYYLMGTEKTTDTHPCNIEIGQVYSMCNEPSTAGANQHGHLEYRFGSNIDLSSATELVINAKAFNYTASSSTTGIVRDGLNTLNSSTTQITTYNNNFILYVQFVDSSNRKTSYIADDSSSSGHTFKPQDYAASPQTADTVTYTISLPSSNFDKTQVKGINFMYMLESAGSSSSGRKKGCWYNSILIK